MVVEVVVLEGRGSRPQIQEQRQDETGQQARQIENGLREGRSGQIEHPRAKGEDDVLGTVHTICH